MPEIKVGDTIGCVGPFSDRICLAINIGTLGIPGYSIHHVGIVAEHLGQTYIFESTESERPPCAIKGKRVKGVQAILLKDFVKIPFYNKVWVYPNRRPLYFHERARLNQYCFHMLGRPYDESGAIHSGGLMFSAVSSMLRGENLDQLFCSEFVASARIHTGLLVAPNASWWNPNRLCRHMLRAGECGKPWRAK